MAKLPRSSAGQLGLGATQVRGQGLAPTPVDAVEGSMPGLAKDGSNRAGSGFGGLADMVQVFDAARRENEFQKGKVEIFSAMRDLHTQIEQDPDSDPEGLLTKHEEGIQALRTGLTERYKNDEAILNKLLPQVDNYANEQTQRVRQLSFKRTVDQAKADGMVNDGELLKTLDKASGPKDFDWALQLHGEDVDSKLASGVYGAVEAERRKAAFSATVEGLRQAYTEEQRLNGVYSTLYRQFGKNPNAAVQYVQNPENWAGLGIGHKDALHFRGVFEGQAASDKRRADEARAAGERSEMAAYWKAVDAGNLDDAGKVLSRARNISGDRLVSMKNALKKDQWDDDPKVVADVQRRIWSGELADAGQIAPLMGNGLSPKTAKALREDMDKITKDTPPFKDAPNYFRESLERFNLVYAGPEGAPVREHAARFQAALAHELTQQKLSPYDHRVTDIADTLLKKSAWAKQRTVAGVGLWNFEKEGTEFERMLDQGTLPGQGIPQTAPGTRPAFAPVAPQAKPSSIQQIPASEYSAVKQALASAGKDTSDDTVLAVWLANRSRLKGGK